MQATNQNRTWKTRWSVITAAILGGGLLVFLLSLITVHFLVDLWWFDSVGYGFYFWQRLLYKYAVFAVVAIVSFLIFYLNFRFASRYLQKSQLASSDRGEKQLRKLRIGSRIVYIPLSLVLATVIAIPLFHHWHKFLFYFFGPEAGVNEPVFGKDVSYFLFSFPIYRMIQSRLLLCFILLFLGLALLYWTESRLLDRQDRHLPPAAKWHLSLVLLVTFLIESWDFILQRNELVYKTSYAPLFFGPGFGTTSGIATLLHVSDGDRRPVCH